MLPIKERLENAAEALKNVGWDDHAKVCYDAITLIEHLQAKVSMFAAHFDKLYGTPCEQVRHAQHVQLLEEDRNYWRDRYNELARKGKYDTTD